MIPRQVQNGLIIERTDLSTTNEESKGITVQQECQFILDVGVKSNQCFFACCIFHQKLDLQANVFMQATSGEWSIVDIGLTVKASFWVCSNS